MLGIVGTVFYDVHVLVISRVDNLDTIRCSDQVMLMSVVTVMEGIPMVGGWVGGWVEAGCGGSAVVPGGYIKAMVKCVHNSSMRIYILYIYIYIYITLFLCSCLVLIYRLLDKHLISQQFTSICKIKIFLISRGEMYQKVGTFKFSYHDNEISVFCLFFFFFFFLFPIV